MRRGKKFEAFRFRAKLIFSMRRPWSRRRNVDLHGQTNSSRISRSTTRAARIRVSRVGDAPHEIVIGFGQAYKPFRKTEAERLRLRGIHFTVANLNIDTTTPAGVFVYTMMSALAEFERRTLSQRTKEGLQAARRRGKRIGRPSALTDKQLTHARHCVEVAGKSTNSVAKEMGVPRWTLSRSLKRGMTPVNPPTVKGHVV